MLQKFKETILAIPAIYSLVQWLFGTTAGQRKLLAYMDVSDGQTVLDVGCGTAIILEHLPDVHYHGYDSNEDYLSTARKKYTHRRAVFNNSLVSSTTLPEQLAGKCDHVLALGLFHHLSDEDCKIVLDLAFAALKAGGRFVSIDPVFIDDQNCVAKMLVGADRGRHVRHENKLTELIQAHFRGSCSFHRENLTHLPYNSMVAVGLK
ncbi:class I SAM-dependent methyltransferase [Pseudodesulfovibrio sp.]|nr:class I SAM-dependent methyltransferase [Pseudodesulfovibrio sp.]